MQVTPVQPLDFIDTPPVKTAGSSETARSGKQGARSMKREARNSEKAPVKAGKE